MFSRLPFLIASVVLLGGNISHAFADDVTGSGKTLPDVVTELSPAGTLILLIIYIVFDYLKKKDASPKHDSIEERIHMLEGEVMVGGGSRPNSILTEIQLIKNDFGDINRRLDKIEEILERKLGHDSHIGFDVWDHKSHTNEKPKSRS